MRNYPMDRLFCPLRVQALRPPSCRLGAVRRAQGCQGAHRAISIEPQLASVHFAFDIHSYGNATVIGIPCSLIHMFPVLPFGTPGGHDARGCHQQAVLWRLRLTTSSTLGTRKERSKQQRVLTLLSAALIALRRLVTDQLAQASGTIRCSTRERSARASMPPKRLKVQLIQLPSKCRRHNCKGYPLARKFGEGARTHSHSAFG